MFFLALMSALLSRIQAQVSIDALNSSFPFRAGSTALPSFAGSNTLIVTFDFALYFVPTSTSCFIGINGYFNNIPSNVIADVKLQSTPYDLSTTSFKIDVTINRYSSFHILSYSYIFFDPDWNVFKFYTTSFIMSNILAMDPSMIQNQPLENIKALALRSFDLDFKDTTPPFYFEVYWNGSHIGMAFTTQNINYTYFEASIITFNQSAPFSSTLHLSWVFVPSSTVAFQNYGYNNSIPVSESYSSRYLITAFRMANWNDSRVLSFYYMEGNSQNLMWKWQSNSTYNYFYFLAIYFVIDQCQNPKFPYMLYKNQLCYDECPWGYYDFDSNKRCMPCVAQANCTKCATYSTCKRCNPIYKMIVDVNGKCVDCNPDPADIWSQLPLCYPQDQVVVTPPPPPPPDSSEQYTSSSETSQPQQPQEPEQPAVNPEDYSCTLYRNNTACEPSAATVEMVTSFTAVVSVPTLSLLTSAMTQLVGLFDDFSYYLYHDRIYSKLVQVYFQLANNFTLDRFYPPQIESTVQKIDIRYSDNILHNDLNRSPTKFKQLDGDVYFLKNTEAFFVGTVIFSATVFFVLSLLNYLTNKCYKHKLLKKYQYVGMLVVSLIGGNIQYMTFRCFQQLYQIVPLSAEYIFNLVVCYLMLFAIIMFSVGGMVVFKSTYTKIKEEYIEEELFDSSIHDWFIVSNLLKLVNGFIHSYFHGQSLVQQGLLVVSYLTKFTIFFSFVKKAQEKVAFILQLICDFAMLIFQSLLFAQMFFIVNNSYTPLIQNSLGEIEFAILVLLFMFQIAAPIFLVVKTSIFVLKNRFFYKAPKVDVKGIRIEANYKRNDRLCENQSHWDTSGRFNKNGGSGTVSRVDGEDLIEIDIQTEGKRRNYDLSMKTLVNSKTEKSLKKKNNGDVDHVSEHQGKSRNQSDKTSYGQYMTKRKPIAKFRIPSNHFEDSSFSHFPEQNTEAVHSYKSKTNQSLIHLPNHDLISNHKSQINQNRREQNPKNNRRKPRPGLNQFQLPQQYQNK